MDAFLKTLQTLPEVAELVSRVENGGCPAVLTGTQPVQRACVGAAVAAGAGRPMVFLCADEREARQLAGDLQSLTGEMPVTLLAREWQFRPNAVSSREWERSRLAALHQMAAGNAPVVVATVDALLARTMPPHRLAELSMTLETGGRADLKELTDRLLQAGYSRCDQVEGVGQFALRGGILDVFSPLMEQPVRCEFFDDEIDSLGRFDPGTQRRTENVSSALLLPAAELLPELTPGGTARLAEELEKLAGKYARKDSGHNAAQTLRADAERFRNGAGVAGLDRYLNLICPDAAGGADYLPPDAVVFLCEGGRIEQRVKNVLLQLHQDTETLMEAGLMVGDAAEVCLSGEALFARLADFPVVMLDALPTSRHPMKPRSLLAISARQLSSYGGSLETAVTDLEHYRNTGSAVLVLCGGEVRANNLLRLLEERNIPAVLDLKGAAMPAPGQLRITVGALSAGCEWPELKLAVLTEGQLTAPTQKKLKLKKDSNRQKLQSFTDLSPGDLVVHVHHGIGRFVGIQRMPVDGVEKDYIKIDYAGGDCLYVPVTQLDLVSKYIGGGEEQERTRLNKLGGTEWAKQKTRARKAAKDLAAGLTKLYAERQRRPGFAFSPDSPWQTEFEEAFPYAETGDQLQAIADIKKDMEQPRPMDRLLCGDVGYGKTEVALRAAMKCILDGKQVALLVPTTVLAQQHYATAAARFRAFPVTVEVLSRFRTPKQVKDVLERVKDGRVDLLIGTHKLLGKGVQFKDLGLLIIDEEQRFGVTHKERLRQVARQVDTLTLSATPIPRTLNMAMSGIRDMSTIEQPPQDRQSVQTYVLEHDWGLLADAIRRELGRGGQVYYLHNRVDSIDATAARLRDLLGEDVAIETAHGKMAEGQLSDVMARMSEGEIDVLVCTTIIETGIDIPNVNTLIIEDADNMGLSQLHQLRGRIGRSPRRAYAYLTYRAGKVLTEVAAKRLTAIREYVEFGSGFKIAMRDLEIRGAGNLLGPEQSGYMMSVGYDMYLKLLNDAVLEQQGKTAPARVECSADITVAAYIPESYVPAARQRMDLYRRIAALRTPEDESELTDELLDRYGDVPPPVTALLRVALLRAAAMDCGVTDITQKGRQLVFSFDDRVDAAALLAVCTMAAYRSRAQLSAGAAPRLTLYMQPGEEPLAAAGALVEALRLHETDTQQMNGAQPPEEAKHEE